ncbi:uncharacterized protein [Euwallacea fornicatus]|uniref:uncharacterized protein n=1 Tax=Euwallacea fornicatus TaxID=995702 RepID=UPI00338ECD3D
MESGNEKRVPQAGDNPVAGSDRVQAPVAGVGPMDSGGGQDRSSTRRAVDEGLGAFAGSKKLQRTPPKGRKKERKKEEAKEEKKVERKEETPSEAWRSLAASGPPLLRRVSEGAASVLVGDEFFSAFSMEMPPPTSTPSRGEEGKKRRREMEESFSQSRRELGDALEEAVARVEDLDRMLRAGYRLRPDVMDVMSGLRCVLRKAVRMDGTEEEERMREEIEELKERIAGYERAGRAPVETVSCGTQTATEEEMRAEEQRERVRGLVASGKLREAIRERWEESLYRSTEMVRGDPLAEGHRRDLGLIVGEESSPLRDRVLAMLPELLELEEDEEDEGEMPFLVQGCRMRRKGGGTNVLERYVFFRQMRGDINPEAVLGALKGLVSAARKEGRRQIIVPQIPGTDAAKLRKLGELAAEGSEVSLRFYVPGAAGGAGKSEGAGEEVIFVAREEGTSYLDALKKVRGAVAKGAPGIEIGTVRETKRGEVLLTVPKGGNVGAVRDALTKELGGECVRGGGGRPVAFQVFGLDGVTTGEEVMGAVATAAGVERRRLRLLRLTPSYGSCQTATLLAEWETAAAVRRLAELRVGISRCRIRERLETGRCFRCWGQGHRAGECKGKDRSQLCARCAKDGHKAAQCREERFCPLCDKVGHSAGGPGCKPPCPRQTEEGEEATQAKPPPPPPQPSQSQEGKKKRRGPRVEGETVPPVAQTPTPITPGDGPASSGTRRPVTSTPRTEEDEGGEEASPATSFLKSLVVGEGMED